MSRNVNLTAEHKESFSCVLLLDCMINYNHTYPIVLEKNMSFLEPTFDRMRRNDLVEVKGTNYSVTSEGKKFLGSFYDKYHDFIKIFDVYSMVDMEEGEFAFSSFYEFEEDEDWEKFSKDERWEDLRIAMAELKELDPLQMVFMSFINERRFDLKKEGWEFDLNSTMLWADLVEIVNSAPTIRDIEVANNCEPTDTNACQDIWKYGMDVVTELIQIEMEEADAEEVDDDEDMDSGGDYETVTETVVEVREEEYYGHYYDPFYISPVWAIPLILL